MREALESEATAGEREAQSSYETFVKAVASASLLMAIVYCAYLKMHKQLTPHSFPYVRTAFSSYLST